MSEDVHYPAPLSEGQRLSQLDMFDLPGLANAAYSQAVEIYDYLPKYFYYARTRSLETKNLHEEIPFMISTQAFTLKVYGAIIESDTEGEEALVVYPGSREELVEDALRKIACSEGRMRFDNIGGFLKFSIYELQQELADNNHTYSNTEIKEALTILHQTRIGVVTGDGRKVTSGYLLPSLSMVSNDELKLDRDAKCVVRFHEIVSSGILKTEFRIFNYKKMMSFKSALGRQLFKRLSHKWTYARLDKPYGPVSYMTLLRDAGERLDPKLHNNLRKIRKAFDEMVAKKVIWTYDEKVIKNGRKIVDVQYTLTTGGPAVYEDQPGKSFVADMKRANAVHPLRVVKSGDN